MQATASMIEMLRHCTFLEIPTPKRCITMFISQKESLSWTFSSLPIAARFLIEKEGKMTKKMMTFKNFHTVQCHSSYWSWNQHSGFLWSQDFVLCQEFMLSCVLWSGYLTLPLLFKLNLLPTSLNWENTTVPETFPTSSAHINSSFSTIWSPSSKHRIEKNILTLHYEKKAYCANTWVLRNSHFLVCNSHVFSVTRSYTNSCYCKLCSSDIL